MRILFTSFFALLNLVLLVFYSFPLALVAVQLIPIQRMFATMVVDRKTKLTMSNTPHLKIGELAKQTGLAVGTLRYYSDLGLLQPVTRGDNRYRYYSKNASSQVEFIKKAQSIGFTLAEIKVILEVKERGEKPCSLVKGLLNEKINQLETQIEKMNLFKQELETYRQSWIKNPNPTWDSQEICPLISSISLDSTGPELKNN